MPSRSPRHRVGKRESEVTQWCLTLCDPMDCSLPGSLVHEIFQARVLELELAIKSRFVLLQSFSSFCCARRSKQCARKMAKNQAARWLPEVQGGKHKTLEWSQLLQEGQSSWTFCASAHCAKSYWQRQSRCWPQYWAEWQELMLKKKSKCQGGNSSWLQTVKEAF